MATRQKIFEHVVRTVLGLGDDSSLEKALTAQDVQILTVFDILGMTEENIDNLEYVYDPDGDGQNAEVRPVPTGYKNLVRVLQDYVAFSKACGFDITDWLKVTQDDFNEFRISPEYVAARRSGKIPVYKYQVPTTQLSSSGTTSTPSTNTTTPSRSPVDDFRRGVKRDPSNFDVLKQEASHHQWHRDFEIEAHAQLVGHVCDHTYVPNAGAESDLFEEQKKYIYSVLNKKVQTDAGRRIVRAHVDTLDGQAAYAELKDHHIKSTQADLDTAEILRYLTAVQLGTGMWKGSTYSFIIHFQNTVSKYEKLVDKKDCFSDGMKRTMLENAVNPIPDLRAVKTTADIHKAGGRTVDYNGYIKLLLAAAVTYGSEIRGKKTHRAYVHQVFNDEASYGDEDSDGAYGIDEDIGTILVNATERRPPPRNQRNGGNPSRNGPRNRARMTGDQWYSLSDDA